MILWRYFIAMFAIVVISLWADSPWADVVGALVAMAVTIRFTVKATREYRSGPR